MSIFRRLLLVFALCAAQLAAGAHGIAHAAGDEGALPGHVCELCLSAHDLGAALPTLALPPVVVAVRLQPDAFTPSGRGALPPPVARQRAPPLS